MLTEIVSTPIPAPKPASSHLNSQTEPPAFSSQAGLAALRTGRSTALPVELTAYPDAQPSIIDLPHAHQCPPCGVGFDADSFLDIDCPCAYVGLAPIAERSYSKVVAHCPMCGLDHADARDHDAERD